MGKADKIINEVLLEISLSKKELSNLKKIAKDIILKLKKSLVEEDIIIGGSLAKETLCKKKNQDIDIFVIFKNEEKTKKLGIVLERLKIPAKKVHGSRDYFRIYKDNIIIELIPIVRLDKNLLNKNTTDFSPLHVGYIQKKIKMNRNLANEIRITKQFCLAQGVYGAESYIQGFSGYSLELLVCYYGSFLKFLKRIGKDNYIDIEKVFKNKNEALRDINSSKLKSPIILVDPTYKYRNACAGLSDEALEKLVNASGAFLKKPTKEFFEIIKFDFESWKEKFLKRGDEIYSLKLFSDRDNSDIAATKMKKFFMFLLDELKRKEQKIVAKEFLFDGKHNSEGLFIIRPKKEIDVKGPKVKMDKARKEFEKRRKETFTSKGFIFARERISVKEVIEKQRLVSSSMDVSFEYEKLN